jgi:hypothetical protein
MDQKKLRELQETEWNSRRYLNKFLPERVDAVTVPIRKRQAPAFPKGNIKDLQMTQRLMRFYTEQEKQKEEEAKMKKNTLTTASNTEANRASTAIGASGVSASIFESGIQPGNIDKAGASAGGPGTIPPRRSDRNTRSADKNTRASPFRSESFVKHTDYHSPGTGMNLDSSHYLVLNGTN